ncbi:MAG: molybdenum cofactor guanylyltransferase [Candidatus Omnitrophota bacterium]
MIDDVTCIILAGGKSSRMGRDKSFVRFLGKPLVENVIDKMVPIFKETIIVTNSPHLYTKYNIETRVDILKDRGPLGGIHTGLTYSKNIYNLVVACDMPFLNENLINTMIMAGLKDHDAVVPRYKGRLEPLCSIYSKSCIKPIESAISRNDLKIASFLKLVKTKIIEEDIISMAVSDRSFININTPEELDRCQPTTA